MERARWAFLTGLGLGVAVAAIGCEPERWLEGQGIPSFREIGVAEARQHLQESRATLVQPEETGWGRRPTLAGAIRVREGNPLPPAVIQAGGPILVLAHEPQAARRLAARIARAGGHSVAVVRGGLEAWSSTATAATSGARPRFENLVKAGRGPARRSDRWQAFPR